MYKQLFLLLLAAATIPAYGINPISDSPRAEVSANEEDKECHICSENYNATDRLRVSLGCTHALCHKCTLTIAAARKPLCPFCRAPMSTNNAIRLDNGELVTEEYDINSLPIQTKNELASLLVLVPASNTPYVRKGDSAAPAAVPSDNRPVEPQALPAQPSEARHEYSIGWPAGLIIALGLGWLIGNELIAHNSPAERARQQTRRPLYFPLFLSSASYLKGTGYSRTGMTSYTTGLCAGFILSRILKYHAR